MRNLQKYDTWTVTGLMSGSSLDGIDLAVCRFTARPPDWKTGGVSGEPGEPDREAAHPNWEHEILKAETFPYPPGLRGRLLQASSLSTDQVFRLDRELGSFYGELINGFHHNLGFRPDLVASHGHTLFHQPEKGITFQAGNGQVMADTTGTRVISDFRREDVEQGGQGAPLVPAGDRLLFGEYGACLNLGGIANISYEKDRRMVAYDICPVNMALNHLAELEGKTYDHGGGIARRGTANHDLLRQLDHLPFYEKEPPRSLGREWFTEQFVPLLMSGPLSIPDRMATAAEHINRQVGAAILRSAANRVLVTGGGALNNFLVEKLKTLKNVHIEIPGEQLVLFKEALVFAFLGLLRWGGEINCYASVTGGRKDLSAGMIHQPKQIRR